MFDIEEYIKELNRLKGLAVDRFGNLTAIEKNVLDGSFEWLLENLKFEKGVAVVEPDLNAIMNDFVNKVIEIINTDKGYQTKLTSYLSDLKTIGKNVKEFHSDFNKIDPDKAGFTDAQKALTGIIIDQYTENGLNTHFAQPLKETISRNVVAGMNQKQARQYLEDYIISGKDKSGKLSSYLNQTAIQAVDSYSGGLNVKIMQTFEFTGFTMSGSIIATSSPQCREGIKESKNGYLTNAQMQKIIDDALANPKSGIIEKTTLKNLPINKLHWGCRHEFTPTIKK